MSAAAGAAVQQARAYAVQHDIHAGTLRGSSHRIHKIRLLVVDGELSAKPAQRGAG